MKKPYAAYTRSELQELKVELEKDFQKYKDMDMKLDMSRGKPSIAQLNLSMGMFDVFHPCADRLLMICFNRL